jgi:phage-related protein
LRVIFIEYSAVLVVLFNGFQKKSQKTPQKELDKALKIKQEYFNYKNIKK